MEKITLKLYEFYNLDAELNGIRNQVTGGVISSGLLQEKLPLVTKYWLTDLAKKVNEEKTNIETLKNDLIKKYGEEKDGQITIPMFVDELDKKNKPVMEKDKDGVSKPRKKLNPKYQEFENEFNELLQTEKEIEYKPITLSELEKVETSENYITFFKLVKTEDQPPASSDSK